MIAMSEPREKVVVAMSGGVDSSVAACLLQEQGYDVVGLFMRVGAPESKEESSPDQSSDREGADATTVPPLQREIQGGQAEAGCTSMQTQTGTATPSAEHAHASVGMPPGDADTANALTPIAPPTRAHQGCCSASDAADARYVAGSMGVPFYALNFAGDFNEIMDYFADEYVNGRTPNPCVVCNHKLKFGKLLDYADAVGAKYIATGHYARIEEKNDQRRLCRGVDDGKDQSYVLFGLRQEILDRVLFPVGDLTKDKVRKIAARLNLPNQNKPDSVEICFVPDRDYARVVKQRRPDAFAEGEVVDSDGKVVGTHKGIGHYTVGQRRGLGIAAGHPIYVTQLNVLQNQVTVGEADELLSSALTASKANFLVGDLSESFDAHVKIRYLHKAAPATVHVLADGKVRVEFQQPQRAITPGQAVVFYDGDIVLGGAWIDSATS